jgi:chorismate mutase/prephenate dehydratase
MDHDLSDWRDKIDAVDAQIVALLNQRCQYALEAGRYKQANERDVCDPDRELSVLRHVERLNQGPLPQPVLRRLYEQIMAEMRGLQTVERQIERRRRPRVKPVAAGGTP